jgi:hypothetical protein
VALNSNVLCHSLVIIERILFQETIKKGSLHRMRCGDYQSATCLPLLQFFTSKIMFFFNNFLYHCIKII